MNLLKCVLIIILSLLSSNNFAADRVSGNSIATRSPVLATQAMAATSQPLATQVALDIMKSGGNAIDFSSLDLSFKSNV